MMEIKPLSVSEVNNYLKTYFDSNQFLNSICICGEISNYKLYPSGHHYFSLKDDNSTISCVMFKGSAYSLNFKPENGMSVLAFGSISVYPRDGKYQLYCDALKIQGAGDLQQAFENLKKKLSSEGLFDEAHKKSIPRFPNKICVITSSAGAAIHDIIRIITKRWPLVEINLIPVRVQGAEAPEEITRAIMYANAVNAGDVLIVGRGGGSIEDLWAFNDENVARAIYDSDIPVISAVGHEPDVTISDYVADLRASTPSNAAELVVPDSEEIISLLRQYIKVLNPKKYIDNKRQELDNFKERLFSAQSIYLMRKKQSLTNIKSELDASNPKNVLLRGFSVALKNGKSIKSSEELVPGDILKLEFSSGCAKVTVNEVQN